MNNFDLKKFLVENKLTRVSKTLIKENDQNQSSNPKLLAFVDGDNRQAIKAYRMLGFKVEIDDPANDQYSAEMDFEGYDWMAVLSVLEDCEREGVEPFMTWNGNEYPFPEAMKLADDKAAEGMATGGMNENLNLSRGDTFEFQIGDNLVTYGGGEKVKVLGVKPNLAAALADTENPKAVESLKQDLRKNLIGNEDKNKPFYLVTSKSFPVDKYYIESELELMNNKKAGGMNENLNFSGGEKAAEEFDIDANNGVGIADFLKSMLGHYERIAGEEAVFYELSSEDAAILKMLGFNHLNGEEADM